MVLVNGLSELIEGGRNLQASEKDSLLTLDLDVFRPSNEAGKISLGLDVLSNSVAARILLEQWALLSFSTGFVSSGRHHDLFAFLDLVYLINQSDTHCKGYHDISYSS